MRLKIVLFQFYVIAMKIASKKVHKKDLIKDS